MRALTQPATKTDPILFYQAATALYQEVKMVEGYLRSLNRLQGGWCAYVVRFQIDVQPYGTNLPYDTCVDLTVTTKVLGGARAYVPESGGYLAHLIPGMGVPASGGTMVPFARSFTLGKSSDDLTAAQKKPGPPARKVPDEVPGIIVLPMLVTDSFEALLRDQSTNNVQQFGLALTAMYQGIGANAAAEQTRQLLHAWAGRDLNSTFNVGSLTNDTVRVRLGAQLQGETHKAALTRNHTVTLVVLARNVPRKGFPLGFMTHSYFQEAETGEIPAEGRPEKLAAALAEKLRARTGHTEKLVNLTLLHTPKLLELRDAGDLQGFQDELEIIRQAYNALPVAKEREDTTSSPPSPELAIGDWLWGELASLNSGSTTRTGPLLFSEQVDPVLPPHTMSASLERTNTDMVVRVGGGSHLKDYASLTAELELAGTRLTAAKLEISDDARSITATFPFRPLGRAGQLTLAKLQAASLHLAAADDNSESTLAVGYVDGWPELPAAPQTVALYPADKKPLTAALTGGRSLAQATHLVASLTVRNDTDHSLRSYPATGLTPISGGLLISFPTFATPAKGFTATELKLAADELDAVTYLSFDLPAAAAPKPDADKAPDWGAFGGPIVTTKDVTGTFGLRWAFAKPPTKSKFILVITGGLATKVQLTPAASAATAGNRLTLAGDGGAIVDLKNADVDGVTVQLVRQTDGDEENVGDPVRLGTRTGTGGATANTTAPAAKEGS